jgi:hypothetical protein
MVKLNEMNEQEEESRYYIDLVINTLRNPNLGVAPEMTGKILGSSGTLAVAPVVAAWSREG